MASSESELKSEVRDLTGYTSTKVLSESGLSTALARAKRHIRVQKNLESGFNWYDSESPEREEALFWFTALFSKIETGELDSQTVAVGAIDSDTLLAKDDDAVTSWYRYANQALGALKPDSTIRSASPARSGRDYSAPGYSEESGSSGSTAGGSSDVDVDL